MNIKCHNFKLYAVLGVLLSSDSFLVSSYQSTHNAMDKSPHFAKTVNADKEKSCDVVQWMTNGLSKIVCDCTENDLSDSDDQREEDVQEYELDVSVQDRIKQIEALLKQQNKK